MITKRQLKALRKRLTKTKFTINESQNGFQVRLPGKVIVNRIPVEGLAKAVATSLNNAIIKQWGKVDAALEELEEAIDRQVRMKLEEEENNLDV